MPDRRASNALLLSLGLIAAAVSIPFLRQVARRQTLPPGETLHRVDAGEPGPDGWVRAAPTGWGASGFVVDLPARYRDMSRVVTDADGAQVKSVAVRATTPEGAAFFVEASRRADGAAFPPDRVDTIAKAFEAQGFTRTRLSPDGTAVELTHAEGGQRGRFYLAGPVLYQVTATRARKEDAERFFASFTPKP